MSNLIPIQDPDDPRIELYRSVRERDLVGRQSRFMAEGETVLRAMLRGDRQPESVLLSERQAARLANVVGELYAETPVYVAPQAVLDEVVGFHIHRGVLAVGRRGAERPPGELVAALGPHAVVAVLAGISNHDNVGGVFRNAAAFGIDLVLLDAACCDPLYRKAIRVSVGGALLVPFARVATADEAADLLAAEGFELLGFSPGGAEGLHALRPPPRAAILLGAEGAGLAPELLARTRTIRVDMRGGFDSLNVATTSGIAFHQLTAAEIPSAGARSRP